MATVVIATLCLLLIFFNVFVTVLVLRSTTYEPLQKRFQILLIWILPIVGGAITWYVLREVSRSTVIDDIRGNEYMAQGYPDNNEHSGHQVGGDDE